jgi:hypothetical protein
VFFTKIKKNSKKKTKWGVGTRAKNGNIFKNGKYFKGFSNIVLLK